jgi:ribosomal protein L27
MGNDFTIFATKKGKVEFKTKLGKKVVFVSAS